MSPAISTLLSLGLIASSAIAAPTTVDTGDVSCPGWYIIEKWGQVVAQPTWNSSRIGTFIGCQPVEDLARRDDIFTNVEPGDGVAKSTYVELEGQSTEPPESQIWDMDVSSALCGSTYCDPDKSISVLSNVGGDNMPLVLTLDGNFPDSGFRDAMISAIKEAFFKSVEQTPIDPNGIFGYHSFANFLHLTTKKGDYSGYYLTMRMEDQQADKPGCPSWVTAMGSVFSVVPDVGAVLGAEISIACSF